MKKIFDNNTIFQQLKKGGTKIIHSHQIYCPQNKRLVSWTFENNKGKCNQCKYFKGNSHNGIYCDFK